MTRHDFRQCLAAALVLLACVQAQAALLVVNGAGLLTGARAVDVDGTLYDVDFREGTCVDLFSGCNDSSDFPFSTWSEGLVASNALMDQVFRDVGTPQTAFDSNPSLTYGCVSIFRCMVLTPLGLTSPFGELITATAVNNSLDANVNGFPDGSVIFVNLVTPAADVFANLDVTYAVWSVSPPEPPDPPDPPAPPDPPRQLSLPSSATLALFGLGGVLLSRRRRR